MDPSTPDNTAGQAPETARPPHTGAPDPQPALDGAAYLAAALVEGGYELIASGECAPDATGDAPRRSDPAARRRAGATDEADDDGGLLPFDRFSRRMAVALVAVPLILLVLVIAMLHRQLGL